MEPANILFVIAFIGLPIAIGIWALMTRREVVRRGGPAQGRTAPSSQPSEQRTAATPAARQHGPTADQTIEMRGTSAADQETMAMPQRNWARQVKPVRGQPAVTVDPSRRRFYPPRYAGRSAGVVKRMTPRAHQSFLRIHTGA